MVNININGLDPELTDESILEYVLYMYNNISQEDYTLEIKDIILEGIKSFGFNTLDINDDYVILEKKNMQYTYTWKEVGNTHFPDINMMVNTKSEFWSCYINLKDLGVNEISVELEYVSITE